MDVKLLEPVDWLTVKENMERIQSQKSIIKHYTTKQKKQLVNSLKNTYAVYQVVAILKKRIKSYLNILYTSMRNDTLTPSAKKSLLHKIKINRTVADEMDIEGHPINSEPFYKPAIDSGEFTKNLYNAMENSVKRQKFSKHLNWYSFLHDQDTIRLNEFPTVVKDFQIKSFQLAKAHDEQRIKKNSIFFKLFYTVKKVI